MLEAKSYRRRQRGEAPLDVEAEVTRLLDAPGAAGPAIDDEAARRGPPAGRRPQRTAHAPRRAAARRRGRDRAPARGFVGSGDRDGRRSQDNLYEVEELLDQPGTYFNPQTEVLIVVDDSTSLDQEIFNMEDFEGADWVAISDEVPVDEDRRDELLERFQTHYHPGGAELDHRDRARAGRRGARRGRGRPGRPAARTKPARTRGSGLQASRDARAPRSASTRSRRLAPSTT